jgi:bacterioferritin
LGIQEAGEPLAQGIDRGDAARRQDYGAHSVLDGFPNMQVLDPLHIGQNVKEVLDCDLASEMSARALYEEAATHCHSVKDYVTRDLFESIMKDEESHIDFLETQIDLVAKVGIELYSQHHIGELGD